MIDLIKKIECLKLSDSFIIGEYSFGFTDGKNKAIKEVLELLNQYNIITAPKEIKLSEILNRLKKEYPNVVIAEYHYNFIRIGLYHEYWDDNEHVEYIEEVVEVQDNKITYINREKPLKYYKYKWLDILWIAGTTIIDDLEEQDEQH